MLNSCVRRAGTRAFRSTRQVCFVSASQLASIVIGDSFQRKLFTGATTLPCSTKNTPSRVSPEILSGSLRTGRGHPRDRGAEHRTLHRGARRV